MQELKINVNAMPTINLKVDDLNHIMKKLRTLKGVLLAETPKSKLEPSEIMRKRWIESLHEKDIPQIDMLD